MITAVSDLVKIWPGTNDISKLCWGHRFELAFTSVSKRISGSGDLDEHIRLNYEW